MYYNHQLYKPFGVVSGRFSSSKSLKSESKTPAAERIHGRCVPNRRWSASIALSLCLRDCHEYRTIELRSVLNRVLRTVAAPSSLQERSGGNQWPQTAKACSIVDDGPPVNFTLRCPCQCCNGFHSETRRNCSSSFSC